MPKKKLIKTDSYEVELGVNNKIIKSTGDSILNALLNLKLPPIFKTMGYLYVKHNGKKLDILFPIRKLRMLQKGNPATKQALAKNLTTLMGIRKRAVISQNDNI